METLSFRFICSSIALSIKTIAILGVILIIYSQDLLIVANEALHSELMSHILAIPFLFAFIIYRKRKMIRTVIPFETADRIKKPAYTNEIFGVLLCLTAFLLYWRALKQVSLKMILQ